MKDFIDRRGNQWADWVFSGYRIGPKAPGGWSVSRMMGVPGTVSVAGDPASTLELEFDRAVAKLDQQLVRVVKVHYLSWMGRDQREFHSLPEAQSLDRGRDPASVEVVALRTARQRADACNLTLPTFYRKLDLARGLLYRDLSLQPKRVSRVLKP